MRSDRPDPPTVLPVNTPVIARSGVVTVPEAQSTPSANGRTAQALAASKTARSRRQQEARTNPRCQCCQTRTIQNDCERARRIWWCARCQKYPFGSGFGPDRTKEPRLERYVQQECGRSRE